MVLFMLMDKMFPIQTDDERSYLVSVLKNKNFKIKN